MVLLIVTILLSGTIIVLSQSIVGLNKRVLDLEISKIPHKAVENHSDFSTNYLKGQLDAEHTQRMILESENRSLMVAKVLTAIKQIEMAFNKTDVKVSDIELNFEIETEKDGPLSHTVKAQTFYQCGVFSKLYLNSIFSKIKEIDFYFNLEFEKESKNDNRNRR